MVTSPATTTNGWRVSCGTENRAPPARSANPRPSRSGSGASTVSGDSCVTVTVSIPISPPAAGAREAVLAPETAGALEGTAARQLTRAKPPTAINPVDATATAVRSTARRRVARRAIAARTAHSRSGAQPGSTLSPNAVHI